MEELNDVEFGSDKSTEEAPILIAQRYLNIFRQVHIFNKVKRDQFDDELLALPANIIDLIKSMPGGRLLIEHIEEVKTERGISFVKSKKEDFITDDTSAPSGNTGQTVAMQGNVGSVVMDASFAESLARAMAAAFKQLPAGAGAPAVSADFGKAFEVIAQEIHSSRASLLDILKETRSITNSVIASQVAISKVLENLLNSQNKEKTDAAILSDKIIASQTAITKMLEKMPTVSSSINKETVNYPDIDKKLQDFRNEIKSSVNVSLQSLVERLYENANKKDEKITDYLNVEHKLQAFKSEIKTDIDGSLNKMQTMLQDYAQTIRAVTADYGLDERKNFTEKSARVNISEPTISLEQSEDISDTHSDAFYPDDTSYLEEKSDTVLNTENGSSIGENRKKKKKKKKKNLEQNFANEKPSFERVPEASALEAALPVQETFESKVDNVVADETQDVPAFDGVIHNEAFSHQDDFSNIKLDDTFLDNDAFDKIQSDTSNEPTINEEDLSVLDGLGSLDDFNFSSEMSDSLSDESSVSNELNTTTDILSSTDKMDLALPTQDEEDSVYQESALNTLDSLTDSDGLDFALPEQNSSVEEVSSSEEPQISGLDDLVDSDGLDFALPEQNSSAEEVSSSEVPQISGLDDLVDSDGLDFALPEQGISVAEDSSSDVSQISGLDDLADSDGLDFALPEQGVSIEEETSSDEPEMKALDDFVLTDEPEIIHPSKSENAFDKNEELDDLLSEESTIESQAGDITSEQDTTSSRYSAELEKIRAALTSDNVDISSLEQPIALDEYSDDENLVEEDDSSYDTISDTISPVFTENKDSSDEVNNDDSSNDEDWEWEYVDENGNEIKTDGDEGQDWEWEYVEDDGSENESDNNRQ